MTHADLIDRVIAIMGNSDRTPQARAEEVVLLIGAQVVAIAIAEEDEAALRDEIPEVSLALIELLITG